MALDTIGARAGQVTRTGDAREAVLYEAREDGVVICNLCAHRCLIKPGLRGICGVRENRDGSLVTLVFDRVISAEIDPIEKKPFFHFLPGSLAYSIATVGCNFHCLFCQNWEISQWPRERAAPFPGELLSPQQIVLEACAAGCETIAYTYTEPTIFFELALETGRLAVAAGLRNVFVTNGYMTGEALHLIAPVLHAANVDLKSFSDRYYRKVCGATLAPVLETIRAMRELGIWVEVTTLLVPGMNDSDEEIGALTKWLVSVDRDIPWHVSAFYPAYKMVHLPPTPARTLHRAARIGHEAGLRYVYTGNIPDELWESTACPQCNRWLVRRRGFRMVENVLIGDGRCPVCKTVIAGIWNARGHSPQSPMSTTRVAQH